MQMVKLLRVLQVDPAPPTHTQQPDGRAADAEAGVMAAKTAAVPDRVDMSADSRCKPWETPEGIWQAPAMTSIDAVWLSPPSTQSPMPSHVQQIIFWEPTAMSSAVHPLFLFPNHHACPSKPQ